MTKRVVVIEGEDAAPEAVRPSIALLDRLGLDVEWVRPLLGAEALEKTGSTFPDEARRAIDESDTTLFGAASGPLWSTLFYLRWGKGTYANLRPTRWIPGFQTPLADPHGIDFVIVRENLEDSYVGVEGDVRALAPLGLVSGSSRQPLVDMAPARYAVKVISQAGTERIARFAFDLARRRKGEGYAGKVTCATKHNMLPVCDGFFLEVARRVAGEYPDIAFESYIVDDFARRIVVGARDLDVVLLPNLYGDILSDEAAGLAGGLGVAASGCYGDDYAYFESVHGSAPDIAGRNIINPTATILSAALMLDYLGFGPAAKRLQSAVEAVYAAGEHLTPDQGGRASTTEFCDAVARLL